MKPSLAGLWLLCVGLTIIVVGGCSSGKGSEKSYIRIRIPDPAVEGEKDDLLENKKPVFDEDRVDSRPLQGWVVNQSGAVIKLDCPSVDPEKEASLVALYPSYADACDGHRPHVLPSANLLDGAAKQFDDGLYAALDLACYQGELGEAMPGAVDFIARVFDRLPEDSPAKPFLGAALKLAGKEVTLSQKAAKERARLLKEFEADKVVSKPISFYTWTPELERVWKFYRFLQQEFWDGRQLAVPKAIAGVVAADPDLVREYDALQGFYGRLTNPLICLPVTALLEGTDSLSALAEKHQAHHAAVAVFPPSTSREGELFERVFPDGIPRNVEAMAELIKRIRSGEVNLEPKPDDGWYQYQVYALECLLLPGKTQESERLLLTAKYKKRLIEAFKAMFTKRRETHARQAEMVCEVEPAARPIYIAPRLRIEPCPTVYLRNARAYAFLQNFLRATVQTGRLEALHGLKEGGLREVSLNDELEAIRLRTYGFYLVSCEDIGMAPALLEGEPVDREAAKQAALQWIEGIADNPDLACDTRVAVPIYTDPMAGTARIWVTLGVRLAKLDASYARAPKIRPQGDGRPWQEVAQHELVNTSMLIPVDEFAEVEVRASKIPNRAELRALCDKYKTKEKIIRALERL